MSDNVPKDLCEQKMNNANLRLPPTEVWTDIFSFLPRRTLVQRVQPVNLWFKAICDKNVKSIHIIGDIYDFLRKFGQINEVAQQRQLEALAGNNCSLFGHFRMKSFHISYNDRNEMAKLAVLRHSLDLFRHCQLIFMRPHALCSADERAEYYGAYLATLEPIKPSYIEMHIDMLLHSQLLRHPTTLNCPRLKLLGGFSFWPIRQDIFEWLHHRVDQVDMEEHGEEEEVRCLNFFSVGRQNKQFYEWLLEQCVQNFKQSKVPEDRSCFLLSFLNDENVLDHFEHKNLATGEVLSLERVLFDNGQPSGYYHLLRCLAHRVADNGKGQLFAKLFTPNQFFEFKVERAGDVAKVYIF